MNACNFQAFGFMPPCVLEKGHAGNHLDGFGGCYGRPSPDDALIQVHGSKELRYVDKADAALFGKAVQS